MKRIFAVLSWFIEINEIATDFLANCLSRVARRVSLIVLLAVGGGVTYKVATATRNSAGTYALPTPGVPFQSNQTISSTQVNNSFTDIGSTLTDSLDRNGKGGMLAALRGIDGTLAAPAFSYTSETGSGYFRNAAGDVRMSILGALVGQWTANGLRVASGLVATPGLSFTAETGTGWYRNAAGDIRFAVSGVDKQFLSATGLGIGNVVPISGLTVTGTGQTTASFDTTANLGSAVYVGDAAGGVGNGGAIVFGANNTTSRFASIKAYFTNGGSNSQGDLVISTRAAAADATLTERLRVTVAGVQIGASGTAISKSIRATASHTGAVIVAPTSPCDTFTITVTGAAAGDECAWGPPSALPTAANGGCAITSANTCTISMCTASTTNQTMPTGTYSCRDFAP